MRKARSIMSDTRRPHFGTICRMTAFFFAVIGSAGVGTAYADEDLGKFKDWHAHTYQEDGGKVCNMWSRPISHEEGGKARGDIFAFVTHRPNDGSRRNEVSLEMGYPADPKNPVKVTIGSKSWSFFVLDSSAFAHSTDDAESVKAMQAGSRLVIGGVSARGTKSKYT